MNGFGFFVLNRTELLNPYFLQPSTSNRFLFLPTWTQQRPPRLDPLLQPCGLRRGPTSWALQLPPPRAPLPQPST